MRTSPQATNSLIIPIHSARPLCHIFAACNILATLGQARSAPQNLYPPRFSVYTRKKDSTHPVFFRERLISTPRSFSSSRCGAASSEKCGAKKGQNTHTRARAIGFVRQMFTLRISRLGAFDNKSLGSWLGWCSTFGRIRPRAYTYTRCCERERCVWEKESRLPLREPIGRN